MSNVIDFRRRATVQPPPCACIVAHRLAGGFWYSVLPDEGLFVGTYHTKTVDDARSWTIRRLAELSLTKNIREVGPPEAFGRTE